jgi:hypothetical protein
MNVQIFKAPSQCHDVTSHNLIHVVSPAVDQINYTIKTTPIPIHTKNLTEDTEGSPMQSGTQAVTSCPPLCFPPAPSSLKVKHM